MRFEAIEIWLAPLEYVIVRMLEYYRASGSNRHHHDIAMMLRISGDLMDSDALEGWLSMLDLTEIFLIAERYPTT